VDHVGLIVLRAEALADCEIIADATRLAGERLGYDSPAGLEGCAFQLARLYNAAEQFGMRIAKAFENNIDDERGWHMELLRRLSLTIPGIRPAFLDTALLADLNELRSFRHVVRHAYDLQLQKAKLLPLLEAARRVALRLPEVCNRFVESVADDNGWDLTSSPAEAAE
jgi:hypothetical protein